jgi:hypothetical protein
MFDLYERKNTPAKTKRSSLGNRSLVERAAVLYDPPNDIKVTAVASVLERTLVP